MSHCFEVCDWSFQHIQRLTEHKKHQALIIVKQKNPIIHIVVQQKQPPIHVIVWHLFQMLHASLTTSRAALPPVTIGKSVKSIETLRDVLLLFYLMCNRSPVLEINKDIAFWRQWWKDKKWAHQRHSWCYIRKDRKCSGRMMLRMELPGRRSRGRPKTIWMWLGRT